MCSRRSGRYKGTQRRPEDGKGKRISRTARSDKGGEANDGRFFELSLDLLASAGFDGYLKRVNPAWERTLGWTPEELRSRPCVEFVHPDDRARTAREAARLVEPGAETPDFELRFATKDGGYRWLLFSAQRVPEEQALFAVGKDITERKLGEISHTTQHAVANILVESPDVGLAMPQLLRVIGEAGDWLAGGFWRLDQDSDVLQCRSFWAAEPEPMAPFAAASRELPMHRGEGLPGRVLQGGKPAWLDIAAAPASPRARVAKRTGVHRAIGLPILSEGGLVVGVLEFFAPRGAAPADDLLASLTTISTQIGQYLRRKDAEEALARTASELRRRAAELERSNAELEQFAYVASHDLSEPLRMVSGFVQLLSERYRGRLDSDADEFIGYIVDGVQRMQSLIDDLLSFSRVGRMVEDENVNLNAVLDTARSALVAPISQSQAVIETDPLPIVYGDSRELSQLLQNLLSNAIKFVEDRPPRVRVSARPKGAMWELSVEDNGIGIDPHHAERIFKMFQRLHGRDSYPGTGIGLAICKKIVERHGGAIAVEPREGGGSVFRATLPGAAEPAADAAA